MRIKPSNVQNSSSQEQGEPPPKKLKADQDGMGHQAPAPSAAPQAAEKASLPAASQTTKNQSAADSEAPPASLSAMLGEDSASITVCLTYVLSCDCRLMSVCRQVVQHACCYSHEQVWAILLLQCALAGNYASDSDESNDDQANNDLADKG